jgi:hypothetical protein
LTGLHSYVVQSTITLHPDAGMSPFGIPSTQSFTLVLDADVPSAIVGSVDGQTVLALATTDGRTFRGDDRVIFGSCSPTVTYAHVSFTIHDGLLAGTGEGQATYLTGDIANGVPATMSLTGQPDIEAPALVVADSFDPTDPMLAFKVLASEPLPLDARPTLVAANGDAATLLLPPAPGTPQALSAFQTPGTILRYGETYRVAMDQVVDFAGNAADAAAAIQFTTRAAPPLVPEDGFESVTDATLGGGQILTGAGAPTIAGAKSLYLPIASSSGTYMRVSQLELRLALQPTDTVVAFSYRTVRPNASAPASAISFALGSVGGAVTLASVPLTGDAGTMFRMPDQTTVYLGPVSTAEIPLPAGVTNELILDRLAFVGSCGLPAPPTIGLIIDDLRAE